MRKCKCKKCGGEFLEDDSNPNIHYSIPAELCFYCKEGEKKQDKNAKSVKDLIGEQDSVDLSNLNCKECARLKVELAEFKYQARRHKEYLENIWKVIYPKSDWEYIEQIPAHTIQILQEWKEKAEEQDKVIKTLIKMKIEDSKNFCPPCNPPYTKEVIMDVVNELIKKGW